MTYRGIIRTHPMSIDGSVKCFAEFHNVNCPKGFLYFNRTVSEKDYFTVASDTKPITVFCHFFQMSGFICIKSMDDLYNLLIDFFKKKYIFVSLLWILSFLKPVDG